MTRAKDADEHERSRRRFLGAPASSPASNAWQKRFTQAAPLVAILYALMTPTFAQDVHVMHVGDADRAPTQSTQGNGSAVLPFGTAAGAVEAQNDIIRSKIDQMVAARVQQLNIPGYSLAIIKDSRVYFEKGYGVTSLEGGAAVTPQTIFGLASVTKTFTALALLSLVDKGLINLDDALEKYVKDLPKTWKHLTIRQLASMTAGIPKGIPQERAWPEEMKIVEKMDLLFEPGTNYEYSNCSYRTLGTVIENVTGKSYFEVVRELITQPLAMNASGTQIGVPPAYLAQPYLDQNGPLRNISPYRVPDIAFAAGALFSNSVDMQKYAQALLDGKILSPQGYQTLWYQRPPLSTGKPSNWAFGWAYKDKAPAYGNQPEVSMNGGVPGVASTVMIFPQSNLAFIALSNLRKPPVYQIVKSAAKIYFGSDGSDADQPTENQNTESP